MRFALSDEQQAFAASLESLLSASDTAATARAWADGDFAPGLKLWSRLADQGVNGLIVPEEAGGMNATPVELAIAFEALGRHGVPGPWVESAAYLPHLMTGGALADLAAGVVSTVAATEPETEPSLALDADAASRVFALAAAWFDVDDARTTAWSAQPAEVGERVRSIDPTRRLFRLTPAATDPSGLTPISIEQLREATDHGSLACAAQLLGAGERLLDDSVAYVKQRTQFGRPIGSYQAIKHKLADVRIALDFARPLLWGAALSLDAGATYRGRDVSAAKLACADAAYLAARTALQVHGAIGYTQEFDLSLWILKVRALVNAWGTPEEHRARVIDQLDEYDDYDVRWSVGV
jgi:alkylation response protein AidB-like acyl-CoA dehydrogenase